MEMDTLSHLRGSEGAAVQKHAGVRVTFQGHGAELVEMR